MGKSGLGRDDSQCKGPEVCLKNTLRPVGLGHSELGRQVRLKGLGDRLSVLADHSEAFGLSSEPGGSYGKVLSRSGMQS